MARGFSDHQQWVMTSLYRGHRLTTRDIGRRTTIPLARQAIIMRERNCTGPVTPDHRWRLTRLGRNIVKVVFDE